MTHSDDGSENRSEERIEGEPSESYRGCGASGRTRRKARVLHTRVSQELSEEIRKLAQDLRVPASNLVRNVLEEVFSVVESVSDDVGQLLEEVVEEAEGARDRIRRRVADRRRRRARRHRRAPSDRDLAREMRADETAETTDEASRAANGGRFDDVIGWQPLVLNRDQRCAKCARDLSRGEKAFIGVTQSGPSPSTLCPSCTPTP